MKGQMYNYSIDDSFFFSKPALDEIRSQAELQSESVNFLLRAKTPADLIAIKDELNAKGIVPLVNLSLWRTWCACKHKLKNSPVRRQQ